MARPLPPAPTMLTRPGRIDFRWEAEGIQVAVQTLHRHNDGRVTGHLVVRTVDPLPAGLLHRGDLNLKATRSKKELANALTNSPPLWDWERAVELICDRTLNWLEQGDPVERLLVDPEAEIIPPSYLVNPLMPDGMPTVIYGDDGSLKSTLAIGVAIVCILPWEDNPFGWVPPARPKRLLMLDWEMDKATFIYRIQLFLRGHQLPAIELLYRRCYVPLAQDLEHIQNVIADTNTDGLIIDSLGAASGGDLNQSDPALNFYQGLRSLNLPSLIVAHNTKDKEGDRGIYGNRHYRAYARSVWECRKQQEAGSDTVDLALIDRKANLSGTRKPFGFRFHFENGAHALRISRTDPTSIQGVLLRMSLAYRITHLLKDGPLPLEAIASTLALAENEKQQVSPRLSELKRKGRVLHLPDGSWGLAALSHTGGPL